MLWRWLLSNVAIYGQMKRSLLIAIALLLLVANAMGQGRELSIQTPMGEVWGTLQLPLFPSESVVLIIAGSGPTDRDGNSPQGNLYASSYKLMAEALALHGVASLRYDKRGIAASASPLARNETLRFGHYVDDASKWVDTLRAMGYRKVILVGHSEGAQIALEVAARNDGVAGVVSLCGAGEVASSTLRRQLAAQLLPDYEALMTEAEQILDALAAGERVEEIPAELAMLFHPSLQDYLISWFASDPVKVITEVDVPVLIISGDKDIQVEVRDGELLHAARVDAQFVVVPNMNHVLKFCSTTDTSAQLRIYADEEQSLHPDLMRPIVRFIGDLP